MSLSSSGSIQLISRPDNGGVCNAAGTIQPILYKFCRNEFVVTSVTNNAGNIRFVISGNFVGAFAAGSLYAMVFQGNDGIPPIQVTPTFASFGGGNTTVDTSTPFTTIQGTPTMPCAVFNDRLLNFYLEVELYDSATGKLIFSALRISPPRATATSDTGYIVVDVSKVIQSYLSIENGYDWTSPSTVTPDRITIGNSVISISKTYFIKYRSVWTFLGSPSSSGQATDIIQTAIYGGFNIDDALILNPVNANNYLRYCIQESLPNTLWLTKFNRPKLWLGYPWTISFFAGVSVLVNTWSYQIKAYTKNGSLINTVNYVGGTAIQNSINRLDPQKIWLTALGHTLQSDNPDTVTIMITDGLGGTKQILTIDCVDTSLVGNLKMIYWRNSLGGDAYFGFDFSQDILYSLQSGTKNKRITLRNDFLTLNDWEALNEMQSLGTLYNPSFTELFNSSKGYQKRVGQQIYLINQSGVSIGAICIPTENKTQTKRSRHSIQLLLELPQTR